MTARLHANQRGQLVWLCGIVAVGAALRFLFLDARSFWQDEGYTVLLLRKDLFDMLADISSAERTPPLYFTIAWLWTRLFGVSEAGLRSLSALAGTVTIPVAYLAAKRLISTRAGVAAAVLVAVNPMLVWFSLDARAYALSTLLGGLSFYFFVCYLDDGHRRSLLGWVVVSVLAFFNHYFAVFLVGCEAIWLLAFGRSRRDVVSATAMIVLAGLTVLPLALIHMQQNLFIDRLPWWPRLAQVPATFLVGFQPPWPIASTCVAGLLVLIAIVVLLQRGNEVERHGAFAAAVIGGATVALPIAVSLTPGMDFMLARNFVAATVPLIVVVAAGFAATRRQMAAVMAFAAYLVLSITINLTTAHVSKFEHEDWRGASAAIGTDEVARAIVLTPHFGQIPFFAYRPGARFAPVTGGKIEEIVVCALPPSFRRIGEPSRPPHFPADAPKPPGFELTEVLETASFTLVRYRAHAPQNLKRLDLAKLAFGPPTLEVQDPAVLLEGVR